MKVASTVRRGGSGNVPFGVTRPALTLQKGVLPPQKKDTLEGRGGEGSALIEGEHHRNYSLRMKLRRAANNLIKMGFIEWRQQKQQYMQEHLERLKQQEAKDV